MKEFKQLCVWPGVTLGDNSVKDFENFMLENFKGRVKYYCEVKTLPDIDNNGNSIEGTGGRNDLFFYIHNDDVMDFAIPRLQAGIRWWEDVISYNDNSKHLYTKEFIDSNPITW